MSRLIVCMIGLVSNSIAFAGDDPAPRAVDKRLKIELFAESPQIVTPTGIDVDLKGRVWAIESNTHFPPEGYKGHPTDRILVMSDTTGDGKADRVIQFADGLTHTMSISVRPSGDIYVATRREIFIFNDDDGDDVADRKRRIVHLDTKGNYPHNGLAGFAFDAMTWTFKSITSRREGEAPAEPKSNTKKARQEPRPPGMLGWIYFGFGENLGADYKIIGSDGKSLSGGGEGGNIYRCRIDGSELKQWATGFWNPHASCIDAFGRLFTVDNDPDSLPPCRLLHIIEGGDYGYKYRNGRKGLHPFTAWNGEIPGTLPMVAGTGEAPSGILAYESDGLPKDYIGNLLVGSWGDHRIDRFRLKRKGASFVSIPEPIIQGGENFRPVGLAVAPDGSVYLTDWVLRDYKLHQQGRVWRLSLREKPKAAAIDIAKLAEYRAVANLIKGAESTRMEVRRTATTAMKESVDGRRQLLTVLGDEQRPTRERIEALWALARVSTAVEDFDFMRKRGGPPRIASNWDEVGTATMHLLGTPQLPFDFETESILDFDLLESRDLFVTTKKMNKEIENSSIIEEWFAASVRAETFDEDSFLYLAMNTNDPFLFASIVQRGISSSLKPQKLLKLFRLPETGFFLSVGRVGTAKNRLGILLAARRSHPKFQEIAKLGLKDSGVQVRRAAVQWVAEERFKLLRPQLEAVLNSEPMTTDLLLATFAALEMLDGVNPADIDKTPASKYVLPIVRDSKRSPTVRAQALRLVEPTEPGLDAELMRDLASSGDSELRLESVRTLQMSPIPEAGKLLTSMAIDESLDTNLRAEAVVGMARIASGKNPDKAITNSLVKLIDSRDHVMQLEAIRALRGVTDATARETLSAHVILLQHSVGVSKSDREWAHQLALALAKPDGSKPEWLQPYLWHLPDSAEGWIRFLAETKFENKPDTAAGRRVFFHVHGAGCYKCHTINGRGGRIGPDLSNVGRTLNRKRLVQSILEPSKEIAPQFTAWTLISEDGKVHNGMIVEENKGNLLIGDSKGVVTELKTIDIVDRVPQKKSLMPEKLIEHMTVGEFRNLLAFLSSPK